MCNSLVRNKKKIIRVTVEVNECMLACGSDDGVCVHLRVCVHACGHFNVCIVISDAFH